MAIFNNTATLSYDNLIVNSNTTSGEILDSLTATKNVVGTDYTIGGSLTYIISITNSSTNDVSGISVEDNLGAYAFDAQTLYPLDYVTDSLKVYINGSLSTVPTVNDGPPLLISDIAIPAGGNVLLVYEVKVNSFAPRTEGSVITNTAVINGCSEITTSADVTVTASPELTVSKTVSPETVFCGENVTYTIVIQNSGNTAVGALDDLVVSDIFNPVLSSLSVTLDGQILSEGIDYTYDEITGVFSTTEGGITVPAATYAQGTDGTWIATPGVTVLKITGTV